MTTRDTVFIDTPARSATSNRVEFGMGDRSLSELLKWDAACWTRPIGSVYAQWHCAACQSLFSARREFWSRPSRAFFIRASRAWLIRSLATAGAATNEVIAVIPPRLSVNASRAGLALQYIVWSPGDMNLLLFAEPGRPDRRVNDRPTANSPQTKRIQAYVEKNSAMAWLKRA